MDFAQIQELSYKTTSKTRKWGRFKNRGVWRFCRRGGGWGVDRLLSLGQSLTQTASDKSNRLIQPKKFDICDTTSLFFQSLRLFCSMPSRKNCSTRKAWPLFIPPSDFSAHCLNQLFYIQTFRYRIMAPKNQDKHENMKHCYPECTINSVEWISSEHWAVKYVQRQDTHEHMHWAIHWWLSGTPYTWGSDKHWDLNCIPQRKVGLQSILHPKVHPSSSA